MKKLQLFILFSLLFLPVAFAQDVGEYELTFERFNTMENTPGRYTCDKSTLGIIGKFNRNGVISQIYLFGQPLIIHGGTNSYSFPIDQRLEQLYFSTHKEYKDVFSYSGCVFDYDYYTVLTIPEYTSPFYYQFYDEFIVSHGDLNDRLLGPGFSASFRIRIKPKKLNLFYFDEKGIYSAAETKILPSDDSITIKPTTGFPEELYASSYWEYCVGKYEEVQGIWIPKYISVDINNWQMGSMPYDPSYDNCKYCYTEDMTGKHPDYWVNVFGGTWRMKTVWTPDTPDWVPIYIMGHHEFSISGKGIWGDAFVTDIVNNKKQVRLRLKNVIIADISNEIMLSPRLSAPKVVLAQGEREACYLANDSKITLTFNRNLYAEETLAVQCTPINEDNTLNTEATRNFSLIASSVINQIAILENLPAGRYRLNFVGKYPDSSYTTYTGSADGSYTINEVIIPASPGNITFASVASTPVNCVGGSDGLITMQLSNGIPPFYYRLNDNASEQPLAANPSSEGYQIAGLQAANYTLNIRDSKGCKPRIVNSTIEQTASVEIKHASQNAVSLQWLTQPEEPTGYGKQNGQVTLKANYGAGGYRYEWTKNGQSFTALPNDSTAQNMGSGNYFITANDARYATAYANNPAERNVAGCRDTLGFFLSQPPELLVSISVKQPVSCNGYADGRLVARPTGGKGAYTSFQWFKMNSGIGSPLTGITDSLLNDCPAGDYYVKVTDAYGNEATSAVFTLTQPAILRVSGFNWDKPSCTGGSDAWAEVLVEGGNPPYTYNWTTLGQTTQRVQGLQAGTYRVIINDSKSCPREELYSDVSIADREPIVVNADITPPTTYGGNDGKIVLQVQGGNGDYTYRWHHNGHTGSVLSSLSVNSSIYYAVTVTDKLGCTKDTSFRVIYPLNVTVEVIQSITCSGRSDGSIQATGYGGVGSAYTYAWYEMQDGVKKNRLSQNNRLENIGEGGYRVEVTDEEGTTIHKDYTFLAPDPMLINFTTEQPKCFGASNGKITAAVSGGTPVYTYLWSTGSTNTTIENLQAGDYSLRVTDSKGCFVEQSTTLTAPSLLEVTLSHTPPKAYNYSDASVTANVTGGTAPYTYAWQGRSETASALTAIPHGTYNVTVTDKNGCTAQASVTIENPPLLQVTATESRYISCFGRSDGQLSASSQGGVGSHRYTWYKIVSGTPVQVGEGRPLDQLPAGTYQVKVTDENDIEAYSTEIVLTEPTLLSLTTSANSIPCNGQTTGWVQADVNGGTQPYTYQWTGGGATARVENLTDDKYFVLVRDARGCETIGQAEITVPSGLIAEATTVHPTCYNGHDGAIRLQVSGGQAPYTYSWNNGATTSIATGLTAGEHSVTITGANGCFKKLNLTLKNPEPITINLGGDRTLCRGQQAEFNALIADPAASYQWYKDGLPFAAKAWVSLSQAGNYRVEAIDSRGCKGEGNVTIRISDGDIATNFAIAAKVARGETVRVVNVNYPAPERTEWIIPEDPNIRVLLKNEEYAELVFLQNGTYLIGMRSQQGDCEQTAYKPVEVVDKIDLPQVENKHENLLKQFIVFPNPSTGFFTVKVELNEKADIRLRLVNMMGYTVDERKGAGDSYYEFTYTISGARGVHIIQLLSEKITTSIKIVITP